VKNIQLAFIGVATIETLNELLVDVAILTKHLVNLLLK